MVIHITVHIPPRSIRDNIRSDPSTEYLYGLHRSVSWLVYIFVVAKHNNKPTQSPIALCYTAERAGVPLVVV